jgi:uracil phosphoribosyltransferase
MTEVAVQRPSLARSVEDPLVASADRLERLTARWSNPKQVKRATQAAAVVAASMGVDAVAPSAPEGTVWALSVAAKSGLRLIQPGLTSSAGVRVLLLEPVLLTGSATARTAAALHAAGASFVGAYIGETSPHAVVPTAADLGVDDIAFG